MLIRKLFTSAALVGIGVLITWFAMRDTSQEHSRASHSAHAGSPAGSSDRVAEGSAGVASGRHAEERTGQNASAEAIASTPISTKRPAATEPRPLLPEESLEELLLQVQAHRYDAELLAETLRKILGYGSKATDDSRVLTVLLEVLGDRKSPISGTGVAWAALLRTASDERIATVLKARFVGVDEGDPFPRADYLGALIGLYFAQVGDQRSEAFLELVDRFDKRRGSAFVAELVTAIEGPVDPRVEQRLIQFLDREHVSVAFRALVRINTPTARDAAWSVMRESPERLRNSDMVEGASLLTVDRADELRTAFENNAKRQTKYLTLLDRAPLDVQRSQRPHIPGALRRAITDAERTGDDRLRTSIAVVALRFAAPNSHLKSPELASILWELGPAIRKSKIRRLVLTAAARLDEEYAK